MRLILRTQWLLLLTLLLSTVQAQAQEEFAGPFPSWKNVKTAYGAVGDGVTDDTQAIQNALNDLRTVQTNNWSVLYFPAGTYRITRPLTTLRQVHNDYLGADIIGEDPLTTTLKWDGPAGGSMLRLDAWYNKISRLTFDGQSRASIGLLRAGGFATYGEISDLVFKDFTGAAIDLGHGEREGIAEQQVQRCRFYRCRQGLVTWNYNTLDIYVWNCWFEDCDWGLYSASGAYHAYQNTFFRSRQADLKAGSNMTTSIVGNTSVGSAAFVKEFEAQAYLQGNKIYNTTGIAIDAEYTTSLTMVDNLISSPQGRLAIKSQNRNALYLSNTFAGTNPWPVRPIEQRYNHGVGAYAVEGHPIEHATDNSTATYAVLGRFRYEAGLQWVCPYGTRRTVTQYSITSNPDPDQPSRDPKNFNLYGSNDWGKTWTLLDSRTNEQFTSRSQRRTFAVATPADYGIYELRVLQTRANGTGASTDWVAFGEVELLDAQNQDLTADPQGLLLGADEDWGPVYSSGQVVAAESAHPAPTNLQPVPFPARQNRRVFEVTAFTGAAMQQAINLAAAEPAGSRPVVHLRKGVYTINQTVTVPANVELTLIGDGASEHGSRMDWTAPAGVPGPAMRLLGPSRATLQDLNVSGGTTNGVDGLVVENADQPGGRIYGHQILAEGSGEKRVNYAFDIDGVEQSDVTIIGFGMASFLHGVRAQGGPIRAAGGTAPGQVSFLTGGSSNGCRMYDVTRGGQLTATAVWYEGDWAYVAPLIDLTSASTGQLAIASHLISAILPLPLLATNGFAGRFSFVGNYLDHRASSFLRFGGNGQNARVFSACNTYPLLQDPDAATKTIEQLWLDQTSPAGSIVQLNSNGWPNITNKIVGAVPAAGFVEEQLALLRQMRIDAPTDRPSGVTDVKLLRVRVGGGENRTALAIRAVANQPQPLPVTLIDFVAALQNEAVQLRWNVARELDVAHYEVERANSVGNSWTRLGTIPATHRPVYEFLDQAPAPGTNQYRLRTLDTDGSVQYSPVRTVARPGRAENPLTLYPVPASEQLWARLPLGSDGAINIEISDLRGVVLRRLQAKSTASLLSLDVRGLPPGVYALRCRNAQGSWSAKWVKL